MFSGHTYHFNFWENSIQYAILYNMIENRDTDKITKIFSIPMRKYVEIRANTPFYQYSTKIHIHAQW